MQGNAHTHCCVEQPAGLYKLPSAGHPKMWGRGRLGKTSGRPALRACMHPSPSQYFEMISAASIATVLRHSFDQHDNNVIQLHAKALRHLACTVERRLWEDRSHLPLLSTRATKCRSTTSSSDGGAVSPSCAAACAPQARYFIPTGTSSAPLHLLQKYHPQNQD